MPSNPMMTEADAAMFHTDNQSFALGAQFMG